jgi:glycosyltransferase involved in cell wall biosynthesis
LVTIPSSVMLNALFLQPGASGGVDTYLRGLAPALLRAAPDLRLSIATTRLGAQALRSDGWEAWCDVLEFPCDDGQRVRRQVAEQVLLQREARRRRVQVLHSLASLGPVWTPRLRQVVTLHDVTFFRLDTFGRVTTVGMRAVMRGVAGDADAALTGTATAREEIADVLRLDPAQLLVAHHGFNRAAGPSADAVALRARLGLGNDRLLLCVAAKRPHKNQELLIRSLRRLPDDVRLVLVGHPEAYDRQLRAVVAAEGVADRTTFLDYVPDDELEGLWSTAACAAFPTRNEGFGLPLIEAMDRRVPVACSDIAVLREVGGTIPRFFPVDDEVACAAAIRDALDGEDRRAAGHTWAARYTWDASAAVHLEAYARAMERPAVLGRAHALEA